jgi:peroxiredoxin
MALLHSEPAKLGSRAPAFSLPGVDGKTYTLASFAGSQALVVVFMCNHCPYVIAVQERLNELARRYGKQGVAWVGINPNDATRYPADRFEAMQERSREQGFVFPYLQDESQEVARAYGAVCTPDFFVYTPRAGGEWVLRSQACIDDNWKDESAVKRHYLAEVLDALLAGQEPADAPASMGCSIKWKVR